MGELSGVNRATEVEIILPGANKVLSIAEVQVLGIEIPVTSPTIAPTTSYPTKSPTTSPTTSYPTTIPTTTPTKSPTTSPTLLPTIMPTESPTHDRGDANIAIHGRASQSTTRNGGVASRAIDNNTNGFWQFNSVTHTDLDVNPWWKVNLRTVSSIFEIIVFNRSDSCCSDRILGFELIVRFEDTVLYNSKTEKPDETNVNKDKYVFELSGVNRATEVEIILPGANRVLSIAEVQVLGVEEIPTTSPPTKNPTVSPTSSRPTKSPTVTPTTTNPITSSPTMSFCTDNANWKHKRKTKRNCSWVRNKPGKHCRKKDKNNVTAEFACPIACESAKCIIPKCLNDSVWKPQEEDKESFDVKFGTCNDIKVMRGKNRKKACILVGENIKGKGEIFAYEACKYCGDCNDS